MIFLEGLDRPLEHLKRPNTACFCYKIKYFEFLNRDFMIEDLNIYSRDENCLVLNGSVQIFTVFINPSGLGFDFLYSSLVFLQFLPVF